MKETAATAARSVLFRGSGSGRCLRPPVVVRGGIAMGGGGQTLYFCETNDKR
jgi:hypothetical protein